MISLEEAQARLLALASPLPVETLPLREAIGRWVADDIIARRTQPVRNLSAMDGYAVSSADPGPWRVIGESAAGRPFAGAVGAGETVRIFTGAALPQGTDTVVIQENIVRDADLVRSTAAHPQPGHHVRPAGQDFLAGTVLIRAGERLTPARIALAASGGHGMLAVGRRPRVALLATGDELVPPGSDAGDDRLPESNMHMLAAMFSRLPCDVEMLPIAPDRLDTLVTAITGAECDLLITLGGASVGDHDLVRPALEQCGAQLDFWKVAMRPGKPVMAGRLGQRVVVGLPGNPVSAFVTAMLFAQPLAMRLAGAGDPLPRRESVRLAVDLPANGPRTDHIRARMGAEGAAPVGPNDSSLLVGLAASDLLIVRLPDAPAARTGDLVPAIRIIW